MLYEKALTEGVAFFKWAGWLETTIQKEMIAQIVQKKMPSDAIMDKSQGGKKRKSVKKDPGA